MQPLKLTIDGSFFDSHIYREKLYLFDLDGSISTYNWQKILQSWAVPPDARIALTCAFFQSNYLYGSDFNLLLSDPEIKSVLLKRFAELEKQQIVVTKDHLKHALIDRQDSPLPFPHSSLEIYNRVAYSASSEGVHAATVGPGLTHSFSTRVKKLLDIPTVAVTASWRTLALSCAEQGLWELPISSYGDNGLEQTTELPSSGNDWNFYSIFSSSYDSGGYLANYRLKKGEYSQRYDTRAFENVIPSDMIFGADVDFAWGFKDKICASTDGSLLISTYNPTRRGATSENLADAPPLFRLAERLALPGSYGRVGGRADFRGNTQSGVVRYSHYLMQLSLAQVRSFDNR